MIAWILAIAIAAADVAPGRGYAGVAEVPAGQATVDPAPRVVTATPAAVEPDPVTAPIPPPRVVCSDEPLMDRRRIALQRAGVAMVVVGAAAYVAMIVGMAIGSAAKGEIVALRSRDEIDRRRTLVERGVLANKLAIGGAISGGIAILAGAIMIGVARRRARTRDATASRTGR